MNFVLKGPENLIQIWGFEFKLASSYTEPDAEHNI